MNTKQNYNKIYLEDYPIETINKEVMSRLEPYLHESIDEHYLFSPEGIFSLKNHSQKMVKIIPQDKPIKRITYSYDAEKKFVLLTDESSTNEIEIYSQIPYDHIIHNITKLHYYITKPETQKRVNTGGLIERNGIIIKNYDKKLYDLSIHLVVEGNFSEANSSLLQNRNMLGTFVPSDFYFLANEKLDNYSIQKDFNVFLSMLN